MIGAHLIKTVESYLEKDEALAIQKALAFAEKSHQGQKRATGEDFITHPISVALILAKLHFDHETICAALLHDVVEDTEVGQKEIENRFGKSISDLVSGLTKLNKLRFRHDLKDYSVENLRKMFLAMAQDIRVVFIKLADRLHNLQTLDGLTDEQQKKIAHETLTIYAPIASRLGIGGMKGNLEDLAFKYAYPEEYASTRHVLETAVPSKEVFLIKLMDNLKIKIKEKDIETIDIHGRAKRIFSLYKKLQRYEHDINRIYDLVAVRIIVPTVHDCYTTLGVIHETHKPLIGRIKDYIATPKANGYQSLHTTVITHNGEIAEIQIRTAKMHREAEFGLAAHWFYKSVAHEDPIKKQQWIQQLAEIQSEIGNPDEFNESLKIDFFDDRIFVFTPKGEVLDLPSKATPVDFAYEIHTDIGHACVGAQVNGKMVPLDYRLQNGDMIKILTGKQKNPNRDWLSFVSTNGARNRIRHWFKASHREQNIQNGRKILTKQLQNLGLGSIDSYREVKKERIAIGLNYKNFESLMAALGVAEIGVDKIIQAFYPEKKIIQSKNNPGIFRTRKEAQFQALIEGERGILTNIAQCCNPLPGDRIKAYITKKHGASVHKARCPELKKKSEEDRIVKAYWDMRPGLFGYSNVRINSLDRIGLLKDIAEVFSARGLNIVKIEYNTKTKADIVIINIRFEVSDVKHLLQIIDALEKINGVLSVSRYN